MLPQRPPHCLTPRAVIPWSVRPSPSHLQSHALIADARLDAAGGDATRLAVGTFSKGSGEVWAGSQVHLLPNRRVLLVRPCICASPAYCLHLTCPVASTSPAQTAAHGQPHRVLFGCLLPGPSPGPAPALSHLPRCPPPSPCTCSAQTPPAPLPAAAPPVNTEWEVRIGSAGAEVTVPLSLAPLLPSP